MGPGVFSLLGAPRLVLHSTHSVSTFPLMQETPNERVAAKVRSAAAKRRLTQTDIAGAIGMTQQALSRRLLGQVKFRLDELDRLADLLDTTPENLLGSTDRVSA